MQKYRVVAGTHGRRDETDGLVHIYKRGEAIMLTSEDAARLGKQVEPWADKDDDESRDLPEATLKTTQAKPVAKSKGGQTLQPGDTDPAIPEPKERSSERG